MSKKEDTVAGSFYPGSKEQLGKFFDTFETLLKKHNMQKKFTPKAVIVPHAGYVYSGFSAAAVYANLEKSYERVVVIGPSHRVYFKGCSVAAYESCQTPLGDVTIDMETVSMVQNRFAFCSFYDKAHAEHSTQTQLPFIKHYLPRAKVVEIVYAEIASAELKAVIETLVDEKTLIVISSDLSHFYNLEKANSVDKQCLDAIEKIDLHIESSGCEACGIKGIAAILEYAKEHNLHSQLIDYRTSYDASGDASSVVGYCSAIIK